MEFRSKQLRWVSLFAALAGAVSSMPAKAATTILRPVPKAQFVAGGSSTLNDGIVAYYKAEEASGTRDDASASNDLTDNNTVTQGTGKIGNAADFESGNNEYLSKSGTWASTTGDITVAAWINVESFTGGSGWGAAVMKSVNGEADGDWSLGISNNEVHFSEWQAAADLDHETSSADLSLATWYHVLARRSSGTVTIWVDGVSKAKATAGPSAGWGNVGFEMGRLYTGGTTWNFDGLIDEAVIYHRALSDAEIAELFNSNNGKTCCPFAAP